MTRALPDLSSLRPAGGKRSSKRDRILQIFLRQEGHLSADDLFDLRPARGRRASAARPSTARCSGWSTPASPARSTSAKAARASSRPTAIPATSISICTTCHRSSEFLSSDVESLIEEIAAARNFAATQTVVQIFGTCEECRTGRKTAPIDGATTELVFARDALRMAIATERSGLEFYTRAASLTKRSRAAATVFQQLAAEEGEHLGTLEKRYRELLAERSAARIAADVPVLQGRGAAACSPRAPRSCASGVDDQQALLIGIKCERGSHKFFKRYGERFEDSEGKQIFLEFADEERAHLDLLIREYRALRERLSAKGQRRARRRARPSVRAAVASRR